MVWCKGSEKRRQGKRNVDKKAFGDTEDDGNVGKFPYPIGKNLSWFAFFFLLLHREIKEEHL